MQAQIWKQVQNEENMLLNAVPKGMGMPRKIIKLWKNNNDKMY
ncbi:hypothetical protein [Flavobacterium aestivum]|nr:hypothetical protein [Flavobacterium aestivum]